jgi:hypothetical protein
MAKIEISNQRNDGLKIFPMTLIRVGGLPLSVWKPLACGIPDWGRLQNQEQDSVIQLLEAFDQALVLLADSPLRTDVYNARKAFFQRRKMPAKGLEAQIHAEKKLEQLYKSICIRHDIQKEKQIAELHFEINLAHNFSTLQLFCQNEMLSKGLLYTSHDLLASLPAFANKTIAEFGKKDRRTAFSLLQYLTRGVFKTSPLSQFTTVQIQSLTAMREITVEEGAWIGLKQQVTPNVAILPSIYAVLLQETVFFQSLSVSLNPCISSPLTADSTWLYFDGIEEAFQKINPDPVAELLVQLLLDNQRKMKFTDLFRMLEEEVDASSEQLQKLVFRFIDVGLLEWQLPEQGLGPGWCSGLYNYLGYLPTSPVLTEAAYLLQWMRTAARTMPFQRNEDAQALQKETTLEIKKFLEKHGEQMPSIQPEQIFFEDVMQEHPLALPAGVIETLTKQLAQCWKQQKPAALPPFRARLYTFAEKFLKDKESVDFLEFTRCFLEEHIPDVTRPETISDHANPNRLIQPPSSTYQGQIGALLQIYSENGAYKAVVNAMYPGGGKLFARWLTLFPATVSEQVKSWHDSGPATLIEFPWQGWSNSNFQPVLSGVSLAVPDARTKHLPVGRAILLADVAVGKDAYGFPQLLEKQSNQPILFTDLGLEAPETRPPVMQVLWHLGIPFISSDVLWSGGLKSELVQGIYRRNRVEYQSLILARAAWEFPQEVWRNLFSEGDTQAERTGLAIATLQSLGIPRQFFGQFAGVREKPQFFDLESPVSMLLLEKNLKNGSGNFRLTEMLPTPEQWLGDRVGEFVVEFLDAS